MESALSLTWKQPGQDQSSTGNNINRDPISINNGSQVPDKEEIHRILGEREIFHPGTNGQSTTNSKDLKLDNFITMKIGHTNTTPYTRRPSKTTEAILEVQVGVNNIMDQVKTTSKDTQGHTIYLTAGGIKSQALRAVPISIQPKRPNNSSATHQPN